jgi:aminopeptidase-like protein
MLNQADIGKEIHGLINELYPLCRSITGNGLRETLRLINKRIPLEIVEVPTGTEVFDWTIPKEWNIRDAYVKNSKGVRVIDFRKSNLHVVSYSVPVKAVMTLNELKPHLYSLPDKPEWIPYRTSYYSESWGFCVSHNQLMQMQDDQYEVCIDASLHNGHLTYGECYLEGSTREEVLISCHICHPSLCNDNLSGVALATFLAQHLCTRRLTYSFRFLFLPVTIGAITWLCLNEHRLQNIRHGLVLTCVGDSGHSTYKKSRRGNVTIDRAALNVLKHSGSPYTIIDFSPYGYDERQYCSPGIDLPVGCLMRTPNGCFPEYHTSADNLEFVKPDALADSYRKALAILSILEQNRTYVNTSPKCEPQLGKRGLYKAAGSQENLAMLWVLNLSDGRHSLLDIAERAGMPFDTINSAAAALAGAGLLRELTASRPGRIAQEPPGNAL